MQLSDQSPSSTPSLRPYQDRGVSHIYERNASLITAWMGGGKTAIALTAISELIADGHVRRVLVISTRNICLFTWPSEAAIWAPRLDVRAAVGTPKHRTEVMQEAQVACLNLENITWAEKQDLFTGFDMLIVDESTKLKDSTTKRFKALKKVLRRFKIRVALTGTPISQGLQELWAQVYILDRGRRLGQSFYTFRARHFHAEDPNGWSWRANPGALEDITGKISDLVFSVDNSEYRDQLPSFDSQLIRWEMSKGLALQYRAMEHDFLVELAEGLGTIVADSGGVLVNKLRQMASGFLYTEDATPHWIDQNKFDAFEDFIAGLGGDPCLVAYQFKAELDELRRRVPGPYLGAGASPAQARKAIDAWNRGELQVLYLHPASAGHGLNLQHGGHHLLWFSRPWSLEQFQQTRARIHRSGQRFPVIEHVLVAPDTVDEKIANSLRRNRSTQDALIQLLRERGAR